MTVNPQRVKAALDGLLANADQIGPDDMPVEELIGAIVGNPDADPVDAVGTLVRLLRQASAAIDELTQQAGAQATTRPGGTRLGMQYGTNTSLGSYYRRRIIR